MDDLEIYRAAQATIQEYGDGAGLHAAQRADELMAEGDMEGRAVWHRASIRPTEGTAGPAIAMKP